MMSTKIPNNKMPAKGLELVRSLQHENEELKAEIAKHHKDFERIRFAIDGYDEFYDATTAIQSIRNIVG